MKELWNVYHEDIPSFLLDFMKTKEMERLKNVGMNCGCEYTQFEIFKKCQSYSRYDHSVGVALIVWHFTHDIKQSVAGLLHDIATPAFAHTIDFLNGDYIKQESTEKETENIIKNSHDLIKLLEKYHLRVEDVCDYHLYPIADNEIPKLSADRLEYSLGNMLNYGFVCKERIKQYYKHLYVHNEKQELAFDDMNLAIMFTKDVLQTAKVYICDEDRFSMQALAMIMKEAIEEGVLDYDDLYVDEKSVIDKLNDHHIYHRKWNNFRKYSYVEKYGSKVTGSFCIKAKKRYILPLYKDIRIDVLSDEIKKLIEEFLNISFDYYVLGK